MKKLILLCSFAMLLLVSPNIASSDLGECAWGTPCGGSGTSGNIGPLGVSGDRIMMAYVDHNDTPAAPGVGQKVVRWAGRNWGSTTPDCSSQIADTSNCHQLDNDGSLTEGPSSIMPIFGGRLKGTALSVWLNQSQSGSPDKQQCDWVVYYSSTAALDSWTVAQITPSAGWTECTGHVETGTLSDNCATGATCSSSAGAGDDVVTEKGESFAVALTDCECPDEECRMIVLARDRIMGPSAEDCNQIGDANIAFAVEEVYP